MRPLSTIRTIKAGRFTVTVRALEELDLDLSFDDDGSVARALGAGELEAFAVKASCYLDGHELAADYLGGCIYETTRAFMDHIGIRAYRRKTGHNCGSYFAGMVRSVVRDARKAVADLQTVHVRATQSAVN